MFQFLGGLFTTRAGWLLMLFALSSMLHTGARVSELGLAAFDPEVASGARDEQEVCHRFQENLHAGSPPLDGPVRCPAGGGRYEVTLTPTVTITCPRHGSSR